MYSRLGFVWKFVIFLSECCFHIRGKPFLPCIITEEENESGNGSQSTEDEKMNPSKPFCQISGGRSNNHPRNAHKTAQKRILCGSELLVAKACHKSNEGGSAHPAGEILKGNGSHQHIIIVTCRSKHGECEGCAGLEDS